MNDKYISREAVNDIIEDMRNNHFILMCERINLTLLKSKVAEIPAADVQPVKRGRWELTANPSFRICSECGAWWSSDIADNCFTKYCPKCGARMDGDAE